MRSDPKYLTNCKAFFRAKPGRVLAILAVIVGMALFAGCAGMEKKGPYKKLPSKGKPPTTQTQKTPEKTPDKTPTGPAVQKDVIRPATPEAVTTPARTASLRVVERGKTQLASNDIDRAAVSFREAVNIDSSNGVAYYYLALAESKRNQSAIALGLLDKAEALLAGDSQWMTRIDELRSQLGGTPSRPVIPSPIDQSF